ncbi:MAG TPA: lysine 5,6-aminomutase subunit alpha, partial [Myxococcaceae bacterium]|nr:lysine 5,6-aminomutase subunit alpha [Myxococcaceae bacterium]
MSGPFVQDADIARARAVAQEVIEPVFELIRRHTTVSVERTVLRLFGMADAGPSGVPLPNLMTDRLKAAGVLNRGAAYWYGRALQLGARSPLDAVERIAALPADRLGPLSAEMEGNLREEVRAEARSAVEELRRRVAARDALRQEFPMAPAPHKYVIVATG